MPVRRCRPDQRPTLLCRDRMEGHKHRDCCGHLSFEQDALISSACRPSGSRTRSARRRPFSITGCSRLSQSTAFKTLCLRQKLFAVRAFIRRRSCAVACPCLREQGAIRLRWLRGLGYSDRFLRLQAYLTILGKIFHGKKAANSPFSRKARSFRLIPALSAPFAARAARESARP